MHSLLKLAGVLATISQTVICIDLNADSPDSIKDASATIAYGLTSFYENNKTDGTASSNYSIGTFGKPYYWWESAVAWGTLVDYYAYTNDSSYNPTVTQALLAQIGPDNDYLPPAQAKDLGSDDQAFWALACLDALESEYPSPPSGQPQWLELATNVWNEQASRWDDATCNGGLRWQIYSFNNGYNYKNSISTGAFFQLSARLARYTGNATYSTWADKSYSWLSSSGLITSKGQVFDGTDVLLNCSEINHVQWSYAHATMLYGSSVLYNYTNGSSVWGDRVNTFTTAILDTFAASNVTGGTQDILTETACEINTPVNCNQDQIVMKGIAARWMAKSSVLAPSIRDRISAVLKTSAKAAAASCTGGSDKTTCGFSWLKGEFDNMTGLGEQINALSVIQSLLLLNGNVSPAKAAPITQSGAASNTSSMNGGSSTNGGSSNNTTTSPTPSTSAYKGAGIMQASIDNWAPVVAAIVALVGHTCI